MRRHIFLLTLIFILFTGAIPAYGIDSMEFKEEFGSRFPGEEVGVSINLIEDYGGFKGSIEAFDMHIKYDNTVFEDIEIIKGQMCSDQFNYKIEDGNIYIGDFNLDKLSKGETLFTIKGRIKLDAPVGQTAIEVVESNVFSGENGEKINCGIQQTIFNIGCYDKHQLAKLKNLENMSKKIDDINEENKSMLAKAILDEWISCSRLGVSSRSIKNMDKIQELIGDEYAYKFKIKVKSELAGNDIKDLKIIIDNEIINVGSTHFNNGVITLEGHFSVPRVVTDKVELEVYTNKGLYKEKINVEILKGEYWYDTSIDCNEINIRYGDVDNDNFIGFTDIWYIKSNLGKIDPHDYDIDGDGVITIKDLYYIRKNLEFRD